MEEHVRNDESVYPPQAVLERLYVQQAHPRAVQRLITRSWTKIKSEPNLGAHPGRQTVLWIGPGRYYLGSLVMAIASSAYKKALEGSQQRKEVLVKIDRVSKQFDETLAVDNVSPTSTRARSSPCWAGPARQVDPAADAGGVRASHRGTLVPRRVDITDMPPYERPINMMFQSYALFPT